MWTPCTRIFSLQTIAASFVLGLLAASYPPATAAEWRWQEPTPQGNALRAMAWGHDRYVAVGDTGAILTAPDGENWQALRTDIRASLNAIVFGDGVFVAVGADGAIVRSTDGITWTAVESGTGQPLYHLAYGDQGFVAGGGLTLLTSADGMHWNVTKIEVDPSPFAPSLGGAAWGNNRYVLPLNGDPFASEPAKVLVSTDLKDWQEHVITAPDGDWGGGPLFFRGMTFGQGHFVAAANRFERGITFRSSDGVTWEWFNSPVHNGWTLHMKSLTYDAANDRFVGLSNPNDPPPSLDLFPSVIVSEDGGAWTHLVDLTGPPIQPVRFVHDRLFGLTAFGEIHSSSDGMAWLLRTGGTRAWRLQNLLAGDEVMLAVGNGPAAVPQPFLEREVLVLHSTSGDDWVQGALPAPGEAVVRQVPAAAAGDGTFVLAVQESVGALPMPIQWQWALYVSSDGLAWNRIDLNTLGNFNDLEAGVQGAAYGDGTFVLSASDSEDGAVTLRSTDQGQTWSLLPATGTEGARLGALVHGDNGFLALSYSAFGFNTTVFHSPDGIIWTPVEAWDRPGGSMLDIAYMDGVHLIVGQAPEESVRLSWVLRSTDGGETWHEQRFDDHALGAVSSAGDRFVLGVEEGEVLLSNDGDLWTSSWTGARAFATDALSGGDGRLWIVTGGGGILTSGGDRVFRDRFQQTD